MIFNVVGGIPDKFLLPTNFKSFLAINHSAHTGACTFKNNAKFTAFLASYSISMTIQLLVAKIRREDYAKF